MVIRLVHRLDPSLQVFEALRKSPVQVTSRNMRASLGSKGDLRVPPALLWLVEDLGCRFVVEYPASPGRAFPSRAMRAAVPRLRFPSCFRFSNLYHRSIEI